MAIANYRQIWDDLSDSLPVIAVALPRAALAEAEKGFYRAIAVI